MKRPTLKQALAGTAGLLVLAQLVPYRASNPPVREEPAWDGPETRELAQQACFDCHSNQVKVPWYGYVAPTAWLVRYHVDEARSKLNLSEMDVPQHDADEAAEEAEEGHMPPDYYLKLHPEARLTDAERARLVAGLEATLGKEEHGERPRHGDADRRTDE